MISRGRHTKLINNNKNNNQVNYYYHPLNLDVLQYAMAMYRLFLSVWAERKGI